MARVDYDRIAHLYDTQPHRARDADLELLAFAEAPDVAEPAVLDIGCGTGNQLIADRAALAGARRCGLDRSLGMLRQAQEKRAPIALVQGDAAALPFAPASFDFASCQFAFHHVADKTGMLGEVFRVLRPGGRFVMRNMCPHESAGWLYYEYFPEAGRVDLEDFWPPDKIIRTMTATGFVALSADYRHLRFEQDMAAWLAVVRRRDTCSQLQAIFEGAYRAGLEKLARDIADPHQPRSRPDRLCLLTIGGSVPGSGLPDGKSGPHRSPGDAVTRRERRRAPRGFLSAVDR